MRRKNCGKEIRPSHESEHFKWIHENGYYSCKPEEYLIDCFAEPREEKVLQSYAFKFKTPISLDSIVIVEAPSMVEAEEIFFNEWLGVDSATMFVCKTRSRRNSQQFLHSKAITRKKEVAILMVKDEEENQTYYLRILRKKVEDFLLSSKKYEK